MTTHLINQAGKMQESSARFSGRRVTSVLRLASVILILVAALTSLRSLPLEQAMSAAKGWIAGLGWWGPIVFVQLYIVATVLFVPGTVLTLAAGAMFGLARGTVAVSVGSTIGAATAFLLARYGARNRVAAMANSNRTFSAIDRAIAEGGWKIVGLMRLSPALPFNLQNYLYGVTAVRFWPYVATSWLAMLPGTFLYVYLGHATGAAVGADRQRSIAEWVMLVVGLLATVGVTVYVTRLAKTKLQSKVEQGDENADVESVAPSVSQTTSGVRSTIALSVVAVAMVVTAFVVRSNSAAIKMKITELFGPPQVEMKEAYTASISGPSVDHSAFNKLLQQYVDADGWVDYGSLKSDEARLDAYLELLASSPFDVLGRDQKLAFLLNGYNAATLKLIVENYPAGSIMDIPEAERWDAVRWNFGGNLWSLSQIEHEQIRPKFAEARIHFALVCAAIGCPPLRNEAYVAKRLEEQLNSQTEYVHHHGTWFKYDQKNLDLQLTKLYSWYGGDFEQSAGSVTAFAGRYSAQLKHANEHGEIPSLRFLPYDWSLNSQTNRQPR